MAEEQLRSRSATLGLIQQALQQQAARRQQITALLRKTSHIKRTFKIVNELIPLIQEEPFFQPLANNFRVLSEVAQKIEHIYFPKNWCIYEEREEADYFYILLSGTVHLTLHQYIEAPQPLQEADSDLDDPLPNDHFLQRKNPHRKVVTEPEHRDTFALEDRIVKIVEQGGCFGEIMQEGSQRETNAVAIEACSALRISRKTYEILLKAQLKTQHYCRYHFLQDVPLFKQVSSFALSRVCILMQQERKLYGQTLFKCGDAISKLYVIRSGSFKLMRRIGRYSLTGIGSRIEHKITKENQKNAEYLIVHPGQILGDGEVLEMRSKYPESCLCQSQEASVLSIDRKLFLKILSEDGTVEAVKAVVEAKKKWKDRVATSFLDKRTRNSVMNVFLNDQRCSASKKQLASRAIIQQQISNQQFFYNSLNKTLASADKKQRFSLSKPNSRSSSHQSRNLMAVRKKKSRGVPHGIEDIVKLVKQKVGFQKRFRNQKKVRYLFKFNEEDAPLYIKCRFNRLGTPKKA